MKVPAACYFYRGKRLCSEERNEEHENNHEPGRAVQSAEEWKLPDKLPRANRKEAAKSQRKEKQGRSDKLPVPPEVNAYQKGKQQRDYAHVSRVLVPAPRQPACKRVLLLLPAFRNPVAACLQIIIGNKLVPGHKRFQDNAN